MTPPLSGPATAGQAGEWTPGPWAPVEATDSYAGDCGRWHVQCASDEEYVVAATIGDVSTLRLREEAKARGETL